MKKRAFVVARVGGADSPERQRADEIYSHVLSPVFDEFELEGYRADMDSTPGSITERLISQLISADLVIVDLTGLNPNVFYELGVAHSFGKRVIAIADSVDSLPFDNKDQRTISLGLYPESGLPVKQAHAAIANIRKAAELALADSFDPVSPVKGAAGIASLDQLADEDPVASELSQIRDELSSLGSLVVRGLSRGSARREVDGVARRAAEFLAMSPHSTIDLDDFDKMGLSVDDAEWLRNLRLLQIEGRAARRERRAAHDSESDAARKSTLNAKRLTDREIASMARLERSSEREMRRPRNRESSERP